MFRPKDPQLAAHQQLAHIPVLGRAHIDLATSPYPLPNTVEECTRLDLQHFLLHHYLKTNYFVPFELPHQAQRNESSSGTWSNYLLDKVQHQQGTRLPPPHAVLDVGCGTGRWAVETARQFPQAQVTGIDIVAPARSYQDRISYPANCTLTQGNILHGLPYPDGAFDYVHMRFLNCGIPGSRWQPVINELGRLTAPGGWVEVVEYGLPSNGGPALEKIQRAVEHVLTARGIELSSLGNIDSYLRRATMPFQAIQSQLLDLPIGVHGGGLGGRIAWNLLLLFKNLGPYLIQAKLFTFDEWATLLETADQECYEASYHPIQTFYWTIGQRH